MADIPTKEAFCNTLGTNGKPHGRLAAFTNEAYATAPIMDHLREHPECRDLIVIRPITYARKEGGALGNIGGEGKEG